jgi:hypothetical protein
MDRDEAIRLLTGGPDGVREWNQRRERDEKIPKLCFASFDAAVLYGANLYGVDLRFADLGAADLRVADLRGTVLDAADLRFADLRGALGLVQAQVETARGDGHTRLPEGIIRPGPWAKRRGCSPRRP